MQTCTHMHNKSPTVTKYSSYKSVIMPINKKRR